MTSSVSALHRAAQTPLCEVDARALITDGTVELGALVEAAAMRRDRAWGRALTYSPKVFLPVTNLCRNRCDYCSFRRSPGDAGEWTMTPVEVEDFLAQGREQGCVEALLCLGDTPETGFREYRALLRSWGHERTLDYLAWIGERALAHGLLAHTNAGILSRDDMATLKRVNVSLGLMLETVSERLCEPGMPHHRAPDKRPERRIAMTREAGELRIPFTSGLLIGIGETEQERLDTLLAIRALHRAHGHIQEVIVQNFRAGPQTPMREWPEPARDELARTIALARLVLDDDISVQAPPNLSPEDARYLVRAGVNDFGGISPVTPDFINPGHPWPHLERLGEACSAEGFDLRPRLPIYDSYVERDGFLDRGLAPYVASSRKRQSRGRTIESCLSDASKPTRTILERCLEGRPLPWEDGVHLSRATGHDLHALCLVADTMRREQAGDGVSYVVNRNINFTNVCIKNCKFCAFSRGVRSEQGYYLPTDEVVRRVLEAQDYGATEVCLQAGLSPNIGGNTYIDLCRAVKQAAPDIHIHAFSPEEVKFGAALAQLSVREYLIALKEAGLGSLPGTSAEILDDRLRKTIAPTRITTREWMTVIGRAHELGIPTTSTMMFGHVETAEHRMRHLDLLRSMQRETGGFTEFVPLSFVHEDAPLFARSEVAGVRPGPSGNDVIRLYAISRLMLGPSMTNIQASWVKEGLRQAQWLLSCGVNDLGGTLMNESISTSAGAKHGQLMTPATLRTVIRDADRVPVQRDTAYRTVHEFSADAAKDPTEPLDDIEDVDAVFGSYETLTHDSRFRYEPRSLRVIL